jgi:tetratricopeptide (TPR) repeat protein
MWAVLAFLVVGAAALAGWMTRDRWMAAPPLDRIRAMVDRREFGQADRQIGRYLAAHPNDAQAILLRGYLLFAQQRFDAAAEALEQVPADSVERAPALLQAGRAWEAARRRRDAERVWKDCLQISNDDPELPFVHQVCRRMLCRLYAMERRRDDLWAMTDELVQRTAPQQRHEPLAMRTRFEFEMVEPQVALGELEPALEQDPADSITRRAIGQYHLEASNTEKARAQLYRCVQEDRDSLAAWEAWLRCLFETADIFGLEQAIPELPPEADNSADCWKYRAIVAERKKDLDGAIAAARRAVELRPGEGEHCHRLGQLLMQTGEKDEGQALLARNKQLQEAQLQHRDAYDAYRREYAAGTGDQKVEIAFRLGQGYAALGRRPDAAAWYRVALSENPSHSPSISALEQSQSGAGIE